MERVAPGAPVERAGERDAGLDEEIVLPRAANQVLEALEAVVEPGDRARVRVRDVPPVRSAIRDEPVVTAPAVDGTRASQYAAFQLEIIRVRAARQRKRTLENACNFLNSPIV